MIKFCSFNRKYKTKTFHFPLSPSLYPPLPHRTKPHPIYPVLHACLSYSISRFWSFDERSHAQPLSLSLSLSIFVICLCSSLVTFDVDMLRQSHQLPFTQSDYNICRTLVCVRLFYIFPPFCSNHNHFGEIECILYSLQSALTRSHARSAFVCGSVFFHLNCN